jgi:ribosome-associated translation inhibitor RaiA
MAQEVFVDIPIDFLIRAGQVETTEALRKHADRKLSVALRPFRAQVRHLTLRLVDVNGPRRGVDSRCSISADLITGQRLFVDTTAAWPVAAISHAASRLADAMRRVHRRQAAHRVDSTATLGNARSRVLRFS